MKLIKWITGAVAVVVLALAIVSMFIRNTVHAVPALAQSARPGVLFTSTGFPLMFADTAVQKVNAGGYLPTIGPELSQQTLPGDWGMYLINPRSGTNVIRFSGGGDPSGEAICRMRAYAVDIPVSADTRFGYWLFPQEDNARFVGVDLHCDDGTTLQSTAATDQNGQPIDPKSGHGAIPINAWSQIRCDIGQWLAGKTIDRIDILYDRSPGGGQYRGYVDDITIAHGPLPDDSGIPSMNARPEPAWVKNAVIYEVNTPKFSPTGDFNGVTAQLDRLKDLGITVLWLMPINPPGQERAFGSPYCIRDFYGINPKFGTMDDLHALIDGAHARGMKVILDVALDHTSWDNPLIAEHPEWYRHSTPGLTDKASILSPMTWTDVAALDYQNPGLRSYMEDMLTYWVKTAGFDGFRCDSAELLPTDFWNESRARLESVRPDFLMLAEGHRPDLMTKAFDVDYSFTMYPALDDVLLKHKSASGIEAAWKYEHSQFPKHTLHMRYTENHDLQHAIVRYGEPAALAASTAMLMLDGVPMLYNGMEAGDASPGNFMAPGTIAFDNGSDIARFYHGLFALRKDHPELRDGRTDWIDTSDSEHLVAYTRTDAGAQALVVVNMSNQPVSARLDAPASAQWTNITPSTPSGSNNEPGVVGNSVSIGPYGFYILERKRNDAPV